MTTESCISCIYYLYALVDPRTGRPFYIGKGKKLRCHAHVREWRVGRSGGNQAKFDLIGEIVQSGYEVQIDFLATDLAEKDAYRLESQYISDLGGTLTNMAGNGYAYNSVENALAVLNKAIERFKRPRQWKWGFLQVHGKLPSDADWDLYQTVYEQHLALREALHADIARSHAKKAA